MITFLNLGRYGRLGNQMFQIASTIGMAVKAGYSFGFPHWINHDHSERFQSSEDVSIYKYFRHKLPELERANYLEYRVPWGYHDLMVPDYVSISGYLQSEKYFLHCRSTILYYFELVPYADVPFIDNKCVAIHVRRGDYDDKYHPRLGMEYYARAMEQFPASALFYVFSDDITACRQMFGNRVEYVEGNHYMKDFYLMSLFSNFIIANSSFSWWPAWMCSNPNKKVVAPANWFGPAYTISPKDIYCKDWIVL